MYVAHPSHIPGHRIHEGSDPSALATLMDPGSAAFQRIEQGFAMDPGHLRPINPHVDAVVDPICRWAARHGLADGARVARSMERACFNVLAGYGHPHASFEGFLLAAKWCTWLFFQDDLLCDGSDGEGAGMLGPRQLARAHDRLLQALLGASPDPDDPLATSIHEIGREIRVWKGVAQLERFAKSVRGYFWGNEWEALNRVRAQIPSVSAHTKMRPHAGAAYTAFEFWEIVEDFTVSDALREHVAFHELRLWANNCISWANDLYSLAKEVREGNPNNLVLALARDHGVGIPQAMSLTVEMYNREYGAFRRLVADLPHLGLAEGELDLREYADRLHGWILGNILWSRLTPRYRERLSMMAG